MHLDLWESRWNFVAKLELQAFADKAANKRRCQTSYTWEKRDRKTDYSCQTCGKLWCLAHARFLSNEGVHYSYYSRIGNRTYLYRPTLLPLQYSLGCNSYWPLLLLILIDFLIFLNFHWLLGLLCQCYVCQCQKIDENILYLFFCELRSRSIATSCKRIVLPLQNRQSESWVWEYPRIR